MIESEMAKKADEERAARNRSIEKYVRDQIARGEAQTARVCGHAAKEGTQAVSHFLDALCVLDYVAGSPLVKMDLRAGAGRGAIVLRGIVAEAPVGEIDEVVRETLADTEPPPRRKWCSWCDYQPAPIDSSIREPVHIAHAVQADLWHHAVTAHADEMEAEAARQSGVPAETLEAARKAFMGCVTPPAVEP